MDQTSSELVVVSNSITNYKMDIDDKPYVGQTLPTLDGCYAFYSLYVGSISFDVHKSSRKKYLNTSGAREVASKVYVCNREGRYVDKLVGNNLIQLHTMDEVAEKDSSDDDTKEQSLPVRKQNAGLFRCDCKASITFKLDFKLNKWVVIQFIKQHNHELASPSRDVILK